MKKTFFFLILNFLFLLHLPAQTPDVAISPVKAVSMLGKGILFEPQAGNVNIGFSAPYKPAYGDSIKQTGFQSVRIRYQGSNNPMMLAIKNGPPYNASVGRLLDETDTIIDDLLSKNLAVVLTFYGLTEDNPGDLNKMVSWWGYVANRFKNKSHRLIFDLFVEPWALVKNNDPHRIMDYYNAITSEIRKTNPDRILIYFKILPTDANTNPFGPGSRYFMTQAYHPVPQDAGIYYLWDFHALKPVARDNVRLVEQASEYMDSTKQAVWCGAWDSKTTDNEMWYAKPTAIEVTRRLIDRGISSAYLMMFDGGTAIFDAQTDHNGNGQLNEWTYPGLQNILVSGPDVWWNLLDNPGFEEDTMHWEISAANFSVSNSNENHFLQLPENQSTPVTLTQDVTLAMKNNGPGEYHVLGYFTSTGNTNITFVMKGMAGGQPFTYSSHTTTVAAEYPKLINDSVDVQWNGTPEKVQLIVKISGDSCTADKLGLTQFYYAHPKLNIYLWPGERVHHDNYTQRNNSVMDINGQIRSLMNKGLSNNNPAVTTMAHTIDSITYDLETRLKTLIGTGYQRTPAETQYRTGGYNQGEANSQYKNSVAKYIGGKDQTATLMNDSLIAEQNRARDYFIKTDIAFRKFLYEVYQGYPPEITDYMGIDTSVEVFSMPSALLANQARATYQWLDAGNLYNPVGGATQQTFSPERSGKYAVRITKNNYVAISGNHTIKVYAGTGTVTKTTGIRVFPTVFRNSVHIETPSGHTPYQVVITDMHGRRVVLFSKLYPPENEIHLSLKKGFYLLEVIFPDKQKTFKIIKK